MPFLRLEPGVRVSHYRLVRKLGTGGMGQVYLADDITLHRQVAIKFLVGPADEQARKRLLVEARAAAALDHPGICAVHEIDSDELAGDFIVMQYIEGEPLSARLKRGRLPPGQALGLCARIADALHTAHARGVVHRDLKPQNVILTSSGEPKLLDFGIAKRVAPSPLASEDATESELTDPRAAIGTPGYMAPEQIRNEIVDQRSDLFALGCVLYECLTGQRAFGGKTSAEIKASVLHLTPPPPSSVVPELGPPHDALVARFLEKDAHHRMQSASEALGALRALQPSTGPWPPTGRTDTSTRRRPRKLSMLLLGAAALVVVAVVMWLGPWFRRLPAAPPEAAGWYSLGIKALQEGRFDAARSMLDEAVRLFPGYVLAHLRLADAHSELDNALGASTALVHADAAIPAGTRLTGEQTLRMRAVRASVMRDHATAIAAYRDLAVMHARDASAWLDLGRAQEAAWMRSEAVVTYGTALSLDGQHAAARLRLGALQIQMANTAEGIPQLDEAIRLYQAARQHEGEVEALIRKGELLTGRGRYGDARAAFERAMPLIESRDAFHRSRAKFGLARLTAVDGHYSEAEALSRQTVEEALAAGLYATASQGLIDFGYALTAMRQFSEAALVLARAAELAITHKARRAEMRAKLQRASLLLHTDQFQEAIDASVEPLRFYADQHFPRSEAEGKNIVSRAYEGLERYGDAAKLSAEVITFAETLKDSALAAVAIDNIAGQLAGQGRLPDAQSRREQLESLNRAQKNHLALPFDLTNRAELLIRLGRGKEAELLLAEVVQKAEEGVESYKERLRRTAMLRAMRASIEKRWSDVEGYARLAIAMPGLKAKPDDNFRWGTVLLEHAMAQRRMSRMPTASIVELISSTSSVGVRREIAYWAVQTLLARGEHDRAGSIATAVADEPAVAANAELRWRMLALAAGPNRTRTGTESATIRDAIRELEALMTAWGSHVESYLARPDLATLRQRLQ